METGEIGQRYPAIEHDRIAQRARVRMYVRMACMARPSTRSADRRETAKRHFDLCLRDPQKDEPRHLLARGAVSVGALRGKPHSCRVGIGMTCVVCHDWRRG